MERSASTAIPRSTKDQDVASLTHAHLRALDGLRFIAAFTVLAGHGYWYVVLQQMETPDGVGPIALILRGLPGLGMTLFFVLSGFVIHYNYHRNVGIGESGNGDFFIARFSRLYPLFLVVFAFDFVHLLLAEGYFSGAPRNDFDLFGALPFFLSFTQCWLFIPFDGHGLYEQYSYLTSHAQATAVMWSLSVEFLFYLIYPLLSAWLTRLTWRSLLFFTAAVAAWGILYYGWSSFNVAEIHAIGAALYGSPELAGKFVGWVVFYAPLGRMSEFLLGAAAAQYYLSKADHESRRPPAAATWIAAIAILIWTGTAVLPPWPVAGVYASVIAAPIAGFVLLSVLQPAGASRLLSNPILVKCGEASYSLYLLHFYTMHEWAAPWATGHRTIVRVLLYFAGIAASLVLARAVYLCFERPSRIWLRGHFRTLHLGPVFGVLFAAITLFSIVASLHVHAAGKIAH